jgi:hypothetical protein
MNDDLRAYEFSQHLLINARGYLSAAFFGVGLLALGVVLWKILVICALIYFLHACRFGTRRLEQAGMLMLALGIMSWIDVIPVQALIEHAKMQTTAALAKSH